MLVSQVTNEEMAALTFGIYVNKYKVLTFTLGIAIDGLDLGVHEKETLSVLYLEEVITRKQCKKHI